MPTWMIARCPECTTATGPHWPAHCTSPTCGWLVCACGTVISPQTGLWTAPPR